MARKRCAVKRCPVCNREMIGYSRGITRCTFWAHHMQLSSVEGHYHDLVGVVRGKISPDELRVIMLNNFGIDVEVK